MKMSWWSWVLIVIAAVVVGLFAVQAPEIARYVRIKRM
jgi:Sec-independent protein translocase protein TatA